MEKQRIAIFASGNGSNAEKIIDHFRDHEAVVVSVILTNKSNAGVLTRTSKENIHQIIINNTQASDGDYLVSLMKDESIDFIILSGYLRLIPVELIKAFPSKILNIHPALLPKFGGAGMYGNHVHRAVKAAQEKESGISIHVVDEEYDKGEIIAQHTTGILESDSVEDIQRKVQELEHSWFARDIENYILQENA